MMMLRRWAVGPSVNNSFPEHISESTMTYLDVLTRTSFPEQISKSTGPMTVILHIHVL